MKPLKDQQEDLNSTIDTADQALDRVRDQRADLRKQGKAASTKEVLARLADTEANARERKNAATKSLREVESQLKDSQKQFDLAAAGLKRTQASLDKLTAGNTDLEDQIAALKTEQEEAEKAIADLKAKAEKLKTDFAQGKEKP
jgi:predicted  nucleic acid-binding Zn-ribbon protein